MTVLETTIVVLFFCILTGSGVYIVFRHRKCNCKKLNIFGKKPTNDNYQNWDGSNPDMPTLTI